MTNTENTSAAADEQAAAGTPEAGAAGGSGIEDAPSSMPTAEATAEGSADPGPQSGIFLGERGVVELPAAPLPQFEFARAGGVEEPVYPEGLKEYLERGGMSEEAQAAQALGIEQQQSAPSMAGPSSESSIMANDGGETGGGGTGSSETSNPETGAPAASTTSGKTGSTSGSTSDSGSTSSTSSSTS